PSTFAEVENYERTLLTLIGGDPRRTSPAPTPSTPAADAKRLLLLDANAIGTGTGTFEHQILEQAGWQNYLQQEGLVRLDLEQIASNPPDAILFAAPEHQALANRFAEHPVLRRSMPADAWLSTDYWRWQCPGPWPWALIRQLTHWLDCCPLPCWPCYWRPFCCRWRSARPRWRYGRACMLLLPAGP